MRTTDTLFDLEEIPILLQYLYMDADHRVVVDNGVTKLELRMTDDCYVLAKNLNLPVVPELDYTEMLNVPNMLGIIDQLKYSPPVEYKNEFKSRWEEIRTIAATNVCLNKM